MDWIINYIEHHWRGNLSLPISFWVNGSFTAVIVAVLTVYGSDKLDYSDLSETSWMLATLTLYCVSIIIFVWSIVGIWRSATGYQQKGGALVLGELSADPPEGSERDSDGLCDQAQTPAWRAASASLTIAFAPTTSPTRS